MLLTNRSHSYCCLSGVQVLVDRTYDVSVASPGYPADYIKHILQEAALRDNQTAAASASAAAASYARRHAQRHLSNYTDAVTAISTRLDDLPPRNAVREPYASVYADGSWWAQGDDSGPNEFLALPYLPFFSNCAGERLGVYD